MTSDRFFEKPAEDSPWEVAIIGSGPAGLTAAIYTSRGARSTIVLAGSAWGGQLMLTTDVDNFPGFPEGIQGPELMANMRKQVERFGVEVLNDDVTEVDFSVSPFQIKLGDKTVLAHSIIVATGASTKWLNIPGEDKLRGRGVSSCAPCDAPFFKNKTVIVAGGGDSAMEEALVLAKYATEVTLVHRRDSFKASAAMQKRVLSNPKIKILWNTEIKELIGETKLEKVKLNTLEKGEWEMPIDGLFVAIGHHPETTLFTGKLTMDEIGYLVPVVTDGYKTATNIKGVFTSGDVHDHAYRQAVTAAGFGAMSALDVLKFLDMEKSSEV